jgi:hypothetical protein
VKRYIESDELYDWKPEYTRLWRELVPKTGTAATVQGEVIRIMGTSTREAYQNGNNNWSERHDIQMRFVEATLTDGTFDRQFASEVHSMAAEILESLDTPDLSGSSSCPLYRLTRLAVAWCHEHPDPIPFAGHISPNNPA